MLVLLDRPWVADPMAARRACTCSVLAIQHSIAAKVYAFNTDGSFIGDSNGGIVVQHAVTAVHPLQWVTQCTDKRPVSIRSCLDSCQRLRSPKKRHAIDSRSTACPLRRGFVISMILDVRTACSCPSKARVLAQSARRVPLYFQDTGSRSLSKHLSPAASWLQGALLTGTA